MEECVLQILTFCRLGRILSSDHDELISCLSFERQSTAIVFFGELEKLLGQMPFKSWSYCCPSLFLFIFSSTSTRADLDGRRSYITHPNR